jgi:hypothetical protein
MNRLDHLIIIIKHLMQNSLVFGKQAEKPFERYIPRKVKEPPEMPFIRSKSTVTMTDKDFELCPTMKQDDYKPFIIVPLQKRDKRATCLKAGSVEYGTA